MPIADVIPEKCSKDNLQKQNQNATPAHKLVRTDSNAQKLDKFFAPCASAAKPVSTPPASQEKSLSQKGRLEYVFITSLPSFFLCLYGVNFVC